MIDLRRFSNQGFDRGAPRWREALWVGVRCLFFENPLPVPSGWRVRILRWFGARVGERVVIRSQVKITFPWRLRVGNDVWIGDGVWILSLAPVTVGDSVCLSQRCFLCSGSHDYRVDTFDLITKPIEIRSSSWIAADAFVGPGVTVGPGSVLAAGGVATRTVPPHTLAGGNPAAVIKTL